MITLPTVSQVVYKPIHLDVTVKCSLRTFSAVTMDFGTFSADTVEFSTVKMGILGKFVLILFYSCSGNPNEFLI